LTVDVHDRDRAVRLASEPSVCGMVASVEE
jgi:hypothetical protein